MLRKLHLAAFLISLGLWEMAAWGRGQGDQDFLGNVVVHGNITQGPKASGDTTGATDTASLQSALNGAGNLQLVGTYYVSAGLTVGPNITSVLGWGATLKAAAGFPASTDMVTVTDSTKAIVTGFTIDGSNLARWGISVANGTANEITHNKVQNCTVGIRHLSGTGDVIAHNYCTGNFNQGIVDIGVNGANSDGTLILGNTCSNNGHDAGGNLGWGINVSAFCVRFKVIGNTCENNYQGGITCDVLQTGSPLVLVESNGVVSGNTVSGFSGSNASHGISYQGDIGGAVTSNTVTGASSNGIFLNSRSTVCSGNSLRNNGAWGVSLHATGSGPSPFTPTPGGAYALGPNIYEGNSSGTFVIDANGDPSRIGAEALPYISQGVAALSIFGGTPTIINTIGGSRYIAWSLANAVDSTLIAIFRIPDLWAKMSIEINWTNAGAGSGNVLWRYSYHMFGTAGDNLNVAVTNTVDTTIAAPAQNILSVSQLASNGIAVTPGQFIYLRIGRIGTSGSDTLANAVGLIEVRLQPVWS